MFKLTRRLIGRIKKLREPDLEKAANPESDLGNKTESKTSEKVEKRMEAEIDAAIKGMTEILKSQICWSKQCFIEVHTKDLVKLIIKYYQDTPESLVISAHNHEFTLNKLEKKWSVSGRYLDLAFDVK